MRTKTLLTAIAALAAGITINSSAQVYSANVVGYVTIPTSSGGTFLMDVPFNVGVSNGANEVWPVVDGNPTLPDGSEILIWDANSFSYTGYFSDSGSSSGWDDVNFVSLPGAPTLPVGQGFFLIPAADVTNVVSGTVAVNVGTSNVMSLAGGGTFLVAPVVPYAGAITNGNPTTGAGGPNLSPAGGLPDGSEVLIWDPNSFSYAGYFSDSGSSSGWDDVNFVSLPTPPTIGVGQGFFIIPADSFDWKVGL